jgi:hypothetical protein
VVAITLQNIFDIINDESIWAISLASDNSTHRGQSFFDLCLHAYYYNDLTNLHLITVPMFKRHTAKNMFNMVIKFLDTLYSQWDDKLIEVSSNGKTWWPIVTLSSSRAWFDLLLTRWCAFSARHIRSILSSKLRPNQSWTTFGSNWHTTGRYLYSRKTIL